MTFPTSVNDQITDAVSQSLLTTLGNSKNVAAGTQQQSFVHALGLGMHDAVSRVLDGTTVSDDQSMVNSQIAETLAKLNRQVMDNPGDLAATGLSLSAAQSLSLAIQDAVDHMRRMQMISESLNRSMTS